MLRPLPCLTLALIAWAAPALAFEVKATIQRVDAEQRVVQFTAGQQERTVKVDPDAKILDEKGEPLGAGLEAEVLKPGTVVVLTVERVGDGPLIRGIRLGGNVAATGAGLTKAQTKGTGAPAVPSTPIDTSHLTALNDLETNKYQGFEGGLYPDGVNTRPASHEAAGLALARQIRPLDASGQPSPDGTIGLLGIGFSNTVQAFSGFMKVAQDDASLNPRLKLVNGAVGGMAAMMVEQAETGRGKQYWDTVDERLKAAGVTRAQVQVVWIKETNPQGQERKFPGNAQDLQRQIGNIVRIAHDRFPNLKLAYLTSRTYGGWAKGKPDGGGPGNSEPYSYETAFAVKWLIEQQLKSDLALNFDAAKGTVKAPWMSWGPYIWANGNTPRSDGFSFVLADFMETDQMHESPTGQLKVGKQLVQFFKTDPTTRSWFLKDPG